MTDLRRALKASSIDYKVVKNTLAKRASEGTSVSSAKDSFSGPVAIAVGYDDPVILAKRMTEFSGKNEKLKVTGGVIDGRFLTSEEMKAIALLPPRNVLLSQVVGLLQSPMGKLAGAMNATITSFAYALRALEKKKSL